MFILCDSEAIDFGAFWQSVVNFFSENAWNIVKFFATLLLGIIFIKLVLYIFRRMFNRTRMEKITQQFVLTIIKFLLWLVLILCLISIIGVDLTGVITALSAVVLAIGMALENNISNLANGIIIVSSQMFKKGDYISVDGVEGSIVDIRFLFTTLITPDNKRVTLPNSTIVNNSVVNAGANKTRRVDFTFSVAYETDVELVKKIVVDCMLSNGKVYSEEDKKPFCRLKTLNSSSIDFFANCWCDREDYWDVYYYVVEMVYNEFKKNGISIPYTQLEVRTRDDVVTMPYDSADLPERVEKVRDEEKEFDLDKLIDDVEERRNERRQKRRAKKKKKK